MNSNSHYNILISIPNGTFVFTNYHELPYVALNALLKRSHRIIWVCRDKCLSDLDFSFKVRYSAIYFLYIH